MTTNDECLQILYEYLQTQANFLTIDDIVDITSHSAAGVPTFRCNEKVYKICHENEYDENYDEVEYEINVGLNEICVRGYFIIDFLNYCTIANITERIVGRNAYEYFENKYNPISIIDYSNYYILEME